MGSRPRYLLPSTIAQQSHRAVDFKTCGARHSEPSTCLVGWPPRHLRPPGPGRASQGRVGGLSGRGRRRQKEGHPSLALEDWHAVDLLQLDAPVVA